MNFSLIAACDKERGIGKGGTLPWRLQKELEYFHRVTSEVSDSGKYNAVIMGRKTWESIPEGRRPLQGRLNCVITRDEHYAVPEGVLRFGSLELCLSALEQRKQSLKSRVGVAHVQPAIGDAYMRPLPNVDMHGGIERAFIIGGGELYRQAINLPGCETVFLTEVDGVFGCDTFFPAMPEEFRKVQESDVQEENGIQYQFVTYRNN